MSDNEILIALKSLQEIELTARVLSSDAIQFPHYFGNAKHKEMLESNNEKIRRMKYNLSMLEDLLTKQTATPLHNNGGRVEVKKG